MAETRIDATSVTDQESAETKFSVDPESTDGAGDQKETTWINDRWTQQFGYYKKIPELKAAIDAKAKWTIGKGFVSNKITEIALSALNGIGVDTFNSLLENAQKVSEIGGDSYSEIIRNNNGNLINLKPLNPEVMRIVANRKGLIIRYEQIDRRNQKTVKKFHPADIFHLSRGRIADEIHGISVVDAVEETILARNEAIQDYRLLLRRNVKPIKIWEVDTDDETEIATVKAKITSAGTDAENLIVPKGTISPPTISSVPTNSTLNPLPWINQLTQNFYQEVGVPQIIVGGAQEITEASAKIAYLAWEQTVEDIQLYIEEQVLSQLNLEINLEFPASLQNELLSDNRKAETMQASTPEDTSVQGVGL